MVELPPLGAEQLADLIETIVLCDERRALGFHELSGIVTRVLQGGTVRLDFALTLIERRQRWLQRDYPLTVTASAVCQEREGMTSWYAALLALSPNTIFRALMSSSTLQQCGVVFERIAEHSLIALLGRGSQAVRFGWPSESGRPPEFPEAIAWLAEKLGLRVGGGYRPPRRRDGGVDVVAWRPFPDGRTAFPIVLAQCTIQSDVVSKALDIDIRSWSQWLLMLRDPMTVLMFPHILTGNSEEWNEVTQRHIVMDRIRIVGVLGGVGMSPNSIDGLESLRGETFGLASAALRES